MGAGYHRVDERSMVELRLLLEGNKRRRAFHPEYLSKKLDPESLALSLLISPAFPSLGEGSGSRALLFLCVHVFLSLSRRQRYRE